MDRQALSEFAVMLREHRLAAGLTQEALAERAGLSARGISDLERGVKRAPRHDTVEMLVVALALTPPEAEVFRARARGQAARIGARSAPNSVVAGRGAAISFATIPLVGREDELTLIDRQLAGAAPPCLFLAGEPGIGKSRLLQDAASRATERGFQVLAGGCSQRHGQEPFAPVVDAIERDIQRRDPRDLRALLGGCAWLVRLLPELAEAPIDPLPAHELTPERERRLVFRAVRQFLHNTAGNAGVLLLLDDVQWAAADGLDLLVDLVHHANDIPLLCIGAYRDSEPPMAPALIGVIADLDRAGLSTHHTLRPLANGPAAMLLANVLHDAGDSRPGAAEMILRRAEGVPFYLLSLAEQARSGPAAAALPWSIARSIQQRVQALPGSARLVLATAAVQGREIDPVILQTAAGQPGDVVLDILDAASEARLLVDGGNGLYRFAHDVIREVLEAGLTTARRAQLHKRTGEAIEQHWQSGKPGAELPVERLAHHFCQAGDDERALGYLSRAASRARRAAAHHDEVALLTEALTLAESLNDAGAIAETRLRRGLAYVDLGQWDTARVDLERVAVDLTGEASERLARILVALSLVCHWLLDPFNTRRYATAALRLAEQLDRRDLVSEAMSALAFADSSDGNLMTSLAQYQRAFAVAGSRQHPRLVHAGEMSTLIYYWLGQHEQAVAIGRDTLRLARDVGDTAYTARVLGNLALALTGSGRYAEALETFAEARTFCREHGLSQWLARAVSMEGSLHAALFDFSRAETLAEEAREVARSVNWPLGAVSAAIDLLILSARCGDAGARAEHLLAEATLATAAATGAHGWLWRLRLVQARAELALAREEWTAARSIATEAIAHARLHGRSKYEAFGRTTRAAALFQLHRDEDALADLEAAAALARTAKDPALLLHVAAARVDIAPGATLLAGTSSIVTRVASGLPETATRDRFRQAAIQRGLFAPDAAGPPAN